MLVRELLMGFEIIGIVNCLSEPISVEKLAITRLVHIMARNFRVESVLDVAFREKLVDSNRVLYSRFRSR